MALADLIYLHDQYRDQLIAAISADREYGDIKNLDDDLLMVTSSIRDLHLTEPNDIKQQIKFFLTRNKGSSGEQPTTFDCDTVAKLLDRYVPETAPSGISNTNDRALDTRTTILLGDQRHYTDEIIKQSEVRMSLYNMDFRHKYTSLGNAKFHQTDPSEFVGLHLSDLIGEHRFEQRAKQYCERCFAGEQQSYSYFLDVPNSAARLMSCELTPYRDSDGSVRGALFAIEDITEKMEKATKSAEANAVFQG